MKKSWKQKMSSTSTSESNASSTSSGIASGQNSSGKKLPRIRLIIDGLNVGHTFPTQSKKGKFSNECTQNE